LQKHWLSVQLFDHEMGLASKPILESWKEFDSPSDIVENGVFGSVSPCQGGSSAKESTKVDVLTKRSREC